MSVDRRKFMKITGLAALSLTVGKPPELFSGAELNSLQKRPSLMGKRWAMIIDLRKCIEEGDCTECIQACHQWDQAATESNQGNQFFIPLLGVLMLHHTGAFTNQVRVAPGSQYPANRKAQDADDRIYPGFPPIPLP